MAGGIGRAANFFNNLKDFLISTDIYPPARMNAYTGSDAEDFKQALAQIASELGVDADSLMYVMWHESRLNPQAQAGLNPGAPFDPSRATGLMQWEPSTAQSLGTSTSALFGMSGSQQLPFVQKYFQGIKKTYGPKVLQDIPSVYLAVFYPYALAQQMNFVLGSEVSQDYAAQIAKENPAFDIGKKGYIQKSDIWAFVAKNAFKPGA